MLGQPSIQEDSCKSQSVSKQEPVHVRVLLDDSLGLNPFSLLDVALRGCLVCQEPFPSAHTPCFFEVLDYGGRQAQFVLLLR